jgi:hypothetical protein
MQIERKYSITGLSLSNLALYKEYIFLVVNIQVKSLCDGEYTPTVDSKISINETHNFPVNYFLSTYKLNGISLLIVNLSFILKQYQQVV